MDFKLTSTPEEEAFRQKVSDFLDKELAVLWYVPIEALLNRVDQQNVEAEIEV